jgi:hypothetical protein
MMDLGASRGFLNVTGDCGGLGRRYALATSQPNIEGRFWGGGVVTGGASVSVKSGRTVAWGRQHRSERSRGRLRNGQAGERLCGDGCEISS